MGCIFSPFLFSPFYFGDVRFPAASVTPQLDEKGPVVFSPPSSFVRLFVTRLLAGFLQPVSQGLCLEDACTPIAYDLAELKRRVKLSGFFLFISPSYYDYFPYKTDRDTYPFSLHRVPIGEMDN